MRWGQTQRTDQESDTQPFLYYYSLFFSETRCAMQVLQLLRGATPLDKSIQNHHLNRDNTRSFYVDFKEGGNAKIAR